MEELPESKFNMKLNNNRPRLSVFRSNKYIYAQIIDDNKGKTLLSTNSRQLKKETKKSSKIETAFLLGKKLASDALKAKIKSVIYDRGKYKYHGQVKSLAEGAREAGLII